MNLIQKFVVAGIALSASASSFAASALDTAALTAITAGYTTMQDTVTSVVSGSWGFMMAVTAILLAPRIVKRVVSNATS